MDAESWLVFLAAALALSFAPGPGMLYVLSRTLAGGRTIGIASTVGTALGGMLHVIAAAAGISAVLAASAEAFLILKYLGAAFLLYLGIRMIWQAFCGEEIAPLATEKTAHAVSIKQVVTEGMVAEALNPKTALFFLAFIPQFIDPTGASVFLNFMLLGTLVVLLNGIPDLLIALFSRPIEQLWASHPKFGQGQQVVSGVVLMGLGTLLATSDPLPNRN